MRFRCLKEIKGVFKSIFRSWVCKSNDFIDHIIHKVEDLEVK